MRTRARAFAVLCVCLLPLSYVLAQQAPAPPLPPVTGTALIVGQAVDAATGTPLASATVTLLGGAAVVGGQKVLTGRDGRFVFRGLPKGNYTLQATKFGYINGAYGRHAPSPGGGQVLDLADGERRGDVTITLWKFAALGGTVLDEAGEPVIGVQVRVLRRTIVAGRRRFTQSGNQPTTDDRGAYRIADLTPGDYIVAIASTTATVPASTQAAYAEALRNGTQSSINSLLDGSGASVSPMPGIQVGDQMVQTNGASFGRGGPPAVISPAAAGGKLFVYQTVYYPAAAAPTQATPITLASGDERSNVDFQLRPVPASRVSGMALGPEGPISGLGLQLIPASNDDLQRDTGFETATTVSGVDGAFTFLGVAAGQYSIRAVKTPPRPVSGVNDMTTVIQTAGGGMIMSSSGGPSTPAPIPDAPTFWASVPVSVADADVTGLAVLLRTGARISGRVEFEGEAERPAPERLNQLSLTIDPVDGRPSNSPNAFQTTRGVVSANGTFTTYQQPAGRYLLRAGSLPGWTLKSAMANGKDVSDVPLDLGGEDVAGVVLLYTDKTTELAGTVRDVKGTGDAGASVLLFPADNRLWSDYGSASRRFKNQRATKDGSFKILAVSAGDYYMIAVPDDFTTNWQDPQLLPKLAAMATRVSISDGEKKTQDLFTSHVK